VGQQKEKALLSIALATLRPFTTD